MRSGWALGLPAGREERREPVPRRRGSGARGAAYGPALRRNSSIFCSALYHFADPRLLEGHSWAIDLASKWIGL
ncbi:hypothetical protein GRJ2_002098300 [Grus japonensis]|uniref:Uncharacterized protein n=1 Tax=Grus japonensis TaxID=30415 RepID=A0ABC9XF99_GRUJA